MYYSQQARLAIYAEGEFGKSSKTAEGVIRYGKNPVAAIIDSHATGKTVESVIGIAADIPIVSSIEEAMKHKPDALLLGSAWHGGHLPPQWRPDILKAIECKLDVINGLHDFLADDPEISAAAKQHGCKLLDVRKPPEVLPVACGRALEAQSFIVLTVGTDCSVGKMTVSLELVRSADKRGKTSAFVATGQTGIMIEGRGIAIDRVIGDFMAGATEQMVVQAAPGNDFVFVEGQGSIVHPGFSGVTMALLHGSCPHAMVLVHNPSRSHMKDTPFEMTSYERLIHLYEDLAAARRPSKVVAIALNTRRMTEAEAQAAIRQAEQETGLPATDAVRYGADKLFDAIVAYQEKIHSERHASQNRH